jgi:hypothetical protein
MTSTIKVDTIQDQDGNNIINENANTVTVGKSGDTVNIVGTLQNNGAAIPGDISSVVAGTGLSGGGTTGAVTLNVEAAQPTVTSTGTLAGFTSTGIDDNATSTAITIDSSERVGIGITSPLDQLSVLSSGIGKVRFAPASGSVSNLLLSGTTTGDSGFQFNSNQLNMFSYGDIAFFPSTSNISGSYPNSEKMRIKNNGNVGIGETAPLAKLHVKSSDSGVTSLNGAADEFLIESSGGTGMTIASATTEVGRIAFADSGNSLIGYVQYDHGNNSMSFQANGSERMRISSSGEVFIGQTSNLDSAKVVIAGAKSFSGGIPQQGLNLVDTTAQNTGVGGAVTFSGKYTNGGGSTAFGSIEGFKANNTGGNYGGELVFKTRQHGGNNLERMRIDSSGSVGIGKTPDGNVGTVGFEVFEGNALLSCRDGNTVAYFNRNTNDGTIISLRQANTEEGTISVSGSTVSYNGFTGTHWSRFQDNSTPAILKGTVLESLDEMCDWYNLEFDVITQDDDGNDVTTLQKIPHVLTDTQSVGDVITYNHEGTDVQATIVKEGDVKHMMSKVSDTVDAKNVYGLFVAYDLDGEGYNDFYVASVGSYVVRIKSGETLAKGDLLQSNGDGTAKVQSDDNIKSSSFAKVLSTTIIETYEDGSYLVPCSLMC